MTDPVHRTRTSASRPPHKLAHEPMYHPLPVFLVPHTTIIRRRRILPDVPLSCTTRPRLILLHRRIYSHMLRPGPRSNSRALSWTSLRRRSVVLNHNNNLGYRHTLRTTTILATMLSCINVGQQSLNPLLHISERPRNCGEVSSMTTRSS